MTRMAITATMFIVLALAGCIDNREIKSLKKTDAALSDEIAFLNTRVKAVEEACLQLNTRIMSSETRGQASDQPATGLSDASRPAKDKIDPVASRPEMNARPTRGNFSRRMTGMTITETLAAIGKPDKVNEESGAKSWIYNDLTLGREGGGTEQSAALIVFDEQGFVSRAVLTEKVQYSSEPKASEPAPAAAPAATPADAPAAAPTNQAVQANQEP